MKKSICPPIPGLQDFPGIGVKLKEAMKKNLCPPIPGLQKSKKSGYWSQAEGSDGEELMHCEP
jgi:hypothetical protein